MSSRISVSGSRIEELMMPNSQICDKLPTMEEIRYGAGRIEDTEARKAITLFGMIGSVRIRMIVHTPYN